MKHLLFEPKFPIFSLCACGSNQDDIFDRYNLKTTSFNIENDLSSYSFDKSGYGDKVYFVIENYKYQGVTGKLNIIIRKIPSDSNFHITSLNFYVNYKSEIAPDDCKKFDEYIMSKYGEPNGTKGKEVYRNLNNGETVTFNNYNCFLRFAIDKDGLI